MATDPHGAGRVADLRRDRRRSDRRRAGRADRRARAHRAAARLPVGQHPARRGSSCSRARRRCCRRSTQKLQALHPAAPGEDGCRDPARTPWPSTWTTSRSRSRARRAWRRSAPAPGSGPPACRPHRWPSMLAEKAGVETDRAGRIPVNPDCTLPGHPEVFAIGDMVSLNKLPGVAQPAMQEGKYVGKVIKARLAGRDGRRAVQVLRQGHDGDHRLPVGGRRRVRRQGHRRPRLPDVGLHPRARTWSAGATGSARSVPVGCATWCSPRTATTGSSPTAARRRTSARAASCRPVASRRSCRRRADRTTWSARSRSRPCRLPRPCRRRRRVGQVTGPVQVFVDLTRFAALRSRVRSRAIGGAGGRGAAERIEPCGTAALRVVARGCLSAGFRVVE